MQGPTYYGGALRPGPGPPIHRSGGGPTGGGGAPPLGRPPPPPPPPPPGYSGGGGGPPPRRLTERQLTAAIASTQTLEQLRQTVLPVGPHLNGIHVCCALSQLASILSRRPTAGAAAPPLKAPGGAAHAIAASAGLGSAEGAPGYQQQMARATADELAPRLLVLLPSLRPREVSTVLYSWGRLGHAPDDNLLISCLRRFADTADCNTALGVGNACWGLAMLAKAGRPFFGDEQRGARALVRAAMSSGAEQLVRLLQEQAAGGPVVDHRHACDILWASAVLSHPLEPHQAAALCWQVTAFFPAEGPDGGDGTPAAVSGHLIVGNSPVPPHALLWALSKLRQQPGWRDPFPPGHWQALVNTAVFGTDDSAGAALWPARAAPQHGSSGLVGASDSGNPGEEEPDTAVAGAPQAEDDRAPPDQHQQGGPTAGTPKAAAPAAAQALPPARMSLAAAAALLEAIARLSAGTAAVLPQPLALRCGRELLLQAAAAVALTMAPANGNAPAPPPGLLQEVATVLHSSAAIGAYEEAAFAPLARAAALGLQLHLRLPGASGGWLPPRGVTSPAGYGRAPAPAVLSQLAFALAKAGHRDEQLICLVLQAAASLVATGVPLSLPQVTNICFPAAALRLAAAPLTPLVQGLCRAAVPPSRPGAATDVASGSTAARSAQSGALPMAPAETLRRLHAVHLWMASAGRNRTGLEAALPADLLAACKAAWEETHGATQSPTDNTAGGPTGEVPKDRGQELPIIKVTCGAAADEASDGAAGGSSDQGGDGGSSSDAFESARSAPAPERADAAVDRLECGSSWIRGRRTEEQGDGSWQLGVGGQAPGHNVLQQREQQQEGQAQEEEEEEEEEEGYYQQEGGEDTGEWQWEGHGDGHEEQEEQTEICGGGEEQQQVECYDGQEEAAQYQEQEQWGEEVEQWDEVDQTADDSVQQEYALEGQEGEPCQDAPYEEADGYTYSTEEQQQYDSTSGAPVYQGYPAAADGQHQQQQPGVVTGIPMAATAGTYVATGPNAAAAGFVLRPGAAVWYPQHQPLRPAAGAGGMVMGVPARWAGAAIPSHQCPAAVPCWPGGRSTGGCQLAACRPSQAPAGSNAISPAAAAIQAVQAAAMAAAASCQQRGMPPSAAGLLQAASAAQLHAQLQQHAAAQVAALYAAQQHWQQAQRAQHMQYQAYHAQQAARMQQRQQHLAATAPAGLPSVSEGMSERQEGTPDGSTIEADAASRAPQQEPLVALQPPPPPPRTAAATTLVPVPPPPRRSESGGGQMAAAAAVVSAALGCPVHLQHVPPSLGTPSLASSTNGGGLLDCRHSRTTSLGSSSVPSGPVGSGTTAATTAGSAALVAVCGGVPRYAAALTPRCSGGGGGGGGGTCGGSGDSAHGSPASVSASASGSVPSPLPGSLLGTCPDAAAMLRILDSDAGVAARPADIAGALTALAGAACLHNGPRQLRAAAARLGALLLQRLRDAGAHELAECISAWGRLGFVAGPQGLMEECLQAVQAACCGGGASAEDLEAILVGLGELSEAAAVEDGRRLPAPRHLVHTTAAQCCAALAGALGAAARGGGHAAMPGEHGRAVAAGRTAAGALHGAAMLGHRLSAACLAPLAQAVAFGCRAPADGSSDSATDEERARIALRGLTALAGLRRVAPRLVVPAALPPYLPLQLATSYVEAATAVTAMPPAAPSGAADATGFNAEASCAEFTAAVRQLAAAGLIEVSDAERLIRGANAAVAASVPTAAAPVAAQQAALQKAAATAAALSAGCSPRV